MIGSSLSLTLFRKIVNHLAVLVSNYIYIFRVAIGQYKATFAKKKVRSYLCPNSTKNIYFSMN